MKKIVIIEDIVQVTHDIKNSLNLFEIRIFNNSKSFLHEYEKQELKEFLSQTDFFLLDFNLGDGTLISSHIYEYILLNKKQDAVLCCISSFGQYIIDKNCEIIAKKYNRSQPFDYYLRKSADLISDFILNFNQK